DKKIWNEGNNFYQEIGDFDLKIKLIQDFRFMKIADHENDLVEYARRLLLQLETCLNYICENIDSYDIIRRNPEKFRDDYNDLLEGAYSFFWNKEKKEIQKIHI